MDIWKCYYTGVTGYTLHIAYWVLFEDVMYRMLFEPFLTSAFTESFWKLPSLKKKKKKSPFKLFQIKTVSLFVWILSYSLAEFNESTSVRRYYPVHIQPEKLILQFVVLYPMHIWIINTVYKRWITETFQRISDEHFPLSD